MIFSMVFGNSIVDDQEEESLQVEIVNFWNIYIYIYLYKYTVNDKPLSLFIINSIILLLIKVHFIYVYIWNVIALSYTLHIYLFI